MKNFFVWDLAIELRKEIVETQKLRTQILQFKVIFLSALIGFISQSSLAELIKVIGEKCSKKAIIIYLLVSFLFLIPAFFSIFFDFLSNGCSVRIDRLGQYCREIIEPHLEYQILKELCQELQEVEKSIENKIGKQQFIIFKKSNLHNVDIVKTIENEKKKT